MVKKRLLLIIALIIGLIVQVAGLEVDVSSSNGRFSTDMSTDYGGNINDYVVHDITLKPGEGGLINHHIGSGNVAKSISSADLATGANALSYIKAVGSGNYAWDTNSDPILGTIQTRAWLSASGYDSISGYSRAYLGSDYSQSSVAVSSGSGLASLDYYTTAYEDASGRLHTAQESYPGAAVRDNPDGDVPAVDTVGDRVTFTETSYNSAGDYALSVLDAKDAQVPYYVGGAYTTTTMANTDSGSQTNAGVTNPSIGSISAYSRALDDYVKSTGTYSNMAKSSASLTSSIGNPASLDYHTAAISDSIHGAIQTGQWIHQGASKPTFPPTSPLAGTYGAKGDSITLAETSYNRLSGITNDYASSSLTAKKATIYDYEGNAITTDTYARVETNLPSDSGSPNIKSSQSIAYKTYAKDKYDDYTSSSASVTGSTATSGQMSGPISSNFGTASSQDSGVQSSINDLTASGNTVSVTSDESDLANRYYLTAYASGNAQYSGTVSSTLGLEAKQQISALTGTGSVYLKDYRKKGSDIQYVTLYPKSKSFSGTAISQDDGHIIQDNVNLAASVVGAANINNRDTLVLSAGTFTENVQLDKSLIIKGAGKDTTTGLDKTIVDGNSAGSVFAIGTTNPDVDVSLSGMKITGGSGTYESYSYDDGYFGGGINNMGRLALSSCTISGNYADWGGGIRNEGTTTIKGSIISDNHAVAAGGIYTGGIKPGAKLIVTGSTIELNLASGSGGGICNWGEAKLTDSTITNNIADIYGGGIYNEWFWSTPGIVTLKNTAITNNYEYGIYNYKGIITILSPIGDLNRNTPGFIMWVS